VHRDRALGHDVVADHRARRHRQRAEIKERAANTFGGGVRAYSEGAGKGSTFLIELPRLRVVSRPHSGERGAGTYRSGPLSVLVIDDNDDARIMLRTLLQISGHKVHEAATGPEAVDVAMRTQPDLALVDLGLPGFDGFEVSRRLRQDVRTRNIVLVALTGYGQVEDREKTASYGFLTHLVKPVTSERLDEVFGKVAQARESRERLPAG